MKLWSKEVEFSLDWLPFELRSHLACRTELQSSIGCLVHAANSSQRNLGHTASHCFPVRPLHPSDLLKHPKISPPRRRWTRMETWRIFVEHRRSFRLNSIVHRIPSRGQKCPNTMLADVWRTYKPLRRRALESAVWSIEPNVPFKSRETTTVERR